MRRQLHLESLEARIVLSGNSVNGGGWESVIVVLDDSVADPGQFAQGLVSSHRGYRGHVYEHVLRGFSADLPAPAIAAMQGDKNVTFVEPNREFHTTEFGITSGVNRVDAEMNFDYAKIDGIDERVSLNVAVLDTGIDIDHPDLNVVGGRNFVRGASNDRYNDKSGHGTHVAGTIGALDNDVGVVGVAPGVNLYAARVGHNSAALSDIIAGLDWIASTRTDGDSVNDIAVVNVSLGGTSGSDALATAYEGLANHGVVSAASAGNYGGSRPLYPARYETTIGVAALADSDGESGGLGPDTSAGPDDTLADFSNYGVEIAAPGVDILSTSKGGGTKVMSGTSMAAPHVTGAAALFIAEYTTSFGVTHNETLPQDRLDFELVREALVATAWGTGDTINDRSDGTLPVLDASGEWSTPPALQFDTPLDGQSLSGTALIEIDARDVDTAPGGLTVSLVVDSVASTAEPNYDTSTGLYEIVIDTTTLSDGVHTFAATASDGTNSAATLDVGALVDNVNNAPTITITNPSDNETVSGSVILTAEAFDDGGVATVQFDVYDESITLVDTLNGTESELGVWTASWDTTGLDGVFSINATATDDQMLQQVAEVTGITVDQQAGQVYVSSDVPKGIKDATRRAGYLVICGEATSTLNIPESRNIEDVNVRLDITHTFDGDLRVQLTSPGGTSVPLFMEVGEDGDNFTNTVLDDEATISIRDAAAPFMGVYRPGGNLEVDGSYDYFLSDFDGENLQGVWTLEINDCGPKDRGTLNSWSLEVVSTAPPAPLVALDQLQVAFAAIALPSGEKGVGTEPAGGPSQPPGVDRPANESRVVYVIPTSLATVDTTLAVEYSEVFADDVDWILDGLEGEILSALHTSI